MSKQGVIRASVDNRKLFRNLMFELIKSTASAFEGNSDLYDKAVKQWLVNIEPFNYLYKTGIVSPVWMDYGFFVLDSSSTLFDDKLRAYHRYCLVSELGGSVESEYRFCDEKGFENIVRFFTEINENPERVFERVLKTTYMFAKAHVLSGASDSLTEPLVKLQSEIEDLYYRTFGEPLLLDYSDEDKVLMLSEVFKLRASVEEKALNQAKKLMEEYEKRGLSKPFSYYAKVGDGGRFFVENVYGKIMKIDPYSYEYKGWPGVLQASVYDRDTGVESVLLVCTPGECRIHVYDLSDPGTVMEALKALDRLVSVDPKTLAELVFQERDPEKLGGIIREVMLH